MRTEVGTVGEGTATVGRLEGSLPRVRAYVSLQQPRSTETLPTGATLAGKGVGADVHLQCAQRHVVFGTVLARKMTLL